MIIEELMALVLLGVFLKNFKKEKKENKENDTSVSLQNEQSSFDEVQEFISQDKTKITESFHQNPKRIKSWLKSGALKVSEMVDEAVEQLKDLVVKNKINVNNDLSYDNKSFFMQKISAQYNKSFDDQSRSDLDKLFMELKQADINLDQERFLTTCVHGTNVKDIYLTYKDRKNELLDAEKEIEKVGRDENARMEKLKSDILQLQQQQRSIGEFINQRYEFLKAKIEWLSLISLKEELILKIDQELSLIPVTVDALIARKVSKLNKLAKKIRVFQKDPKAAWGLELGQLNSRFDQLSKEITVLDRDGKSSFEFRSLQEKIRELKSKRKKIKEDTRLEKNIDSQQSELLKTESDLLQQLDVKKLDNDVITLSLDNISKKISDLQNQKDLLKEKAKYIHYSLERLDIEIFYKAKRLLNQIKTRGDESAELYELNKLPEISKTKKGLLYLLRIKELLINKQKAEIDLINKQNNFQELFILGEEKQTDNNEEIIESYNEDIRELKEIPNALNKSNKRIEIYTELSELFSPDEKQLIKETLRTEKQSQRRLEEAKPIYEGRIRNIIDNLHLQNRDRSNDGWFFNIIKKIKSLFTSEVKYLDGISFEALPYLLDPIQDKQESLIEQLSKDINQQQSYAVQSSLGVLQSENDLLEKHKVAIKYYDDLERSVLSYLRRSPQTFMEKKYPLLHASFQRLSKIEEEQAEFERYVIGMNYVNLDFYKKQAFAKKDLQLRITENNKSSSEHNSKDLILSNYTQKVEKYKLSLYSKVFNSLLDNIVNMIATNKSLTKEFKSALKDSNLLRNLITRLEKKRQSYIGQQTISGAVQFAEVVDFSLWYYHVERDTMHNIQLKNLFNNITDVITRDVPKHLNVEQNRSKIISEIKTAIEKEEEKYIEKLQNMSEEFQRSCGSLSKALYTKPHSVIQTASNSHEAVIVEFKKVQNAIEALGSYKEILNLLIQIEKDTQAFDKIIHLKNNHNESIKEEFLAFHGQIISLKEYLEGVWSKQILCLSDEKLQKKISSLKENSVFQGMLNKKCLNETDLDFNYLQPNSDALDKLMKVGDQVQVSFVHEDIEGTDFSCKKDFRSDLQNQPLSMFSPIVLIPCIIGGVALFSYAAFNYFKKNVENENDQNNNQEEQGAQPTMDTMGDIVDASSF